ncbi:copper homeostasis protein CutC [Luteipulveratus mongoliensis]|uniref:Copper homeostasis protein cutC homolog n=1 Tax=Luteipulveratus mongoliensis TaxID=571913 RepID=A0A0K1JI88_9MICO|nr:copper homeostasis protein CutC [Luteipulveratus mongoliensis]AKU16437.1 hypothetical protein VV02_12115 [Luteipulveratus mongoliensis]
MLLEVIVTDVSDATAAAAGGADRLELVAAPDLGGMTPDTAIAADVVAAVDIPVRVMVRRTESHCITADDAMRLARDVAALRGVLADGYVVGATRADGSPDVDRLAPVLDALDGLAFTFHRAIDTSPALAESMRAVLDLPGCDVVLTAGHPDGVESGLPRLHDLLADPAAPPSGAVLVGGGLRSHHLPDLARAGVRAVHLGRGVRPDGSWRTSVDAGRVARLRELVDSLAPA